MSTVMTELFIKGNSWFAAEILHCWRQYALSMSACQGSGAPQHPLQLLLLKLLRSRLFYGLLRLGLPSSHSHSCSPICVLSP